MIHLRYDMIAAYHLQESRHPQIVMGDLGITYQISTPQSICDQWWFWQCDGIPLVLPAFLSELEIDPAQCVGWGLSIEEAAWLKDRE